ncbi:MAG TPA: alternative ribosome rescue aminoacyl-tRNA hydrolase ArfB [Thermoanaerobaculaceae bacterium]|nr:alternative ribosome rescue aminoacyl-tRNA hydrolase ArfB [Thermoanaerobaculaceae bacterium]
MIEIFTGLAIPDGEVRFSASRAGGPGGQNVNKVATKVTLTFDVAGSPDLSEAQRAHIRERLATRISRDGILHVVSQRHRTQGANRAAALERFVDLLRYALAEESARVPTRPTPVSRERRVADKKLHARIKESRRRPLPEE